MSDLNDELQHVDDPSDELGYTEYDWANLPKDEARRHDELIGMAEDEVLALDWDTLSDLELWAVAQVLGDADNPQSDVLTDRIVAGERKHPAIDYFGLAVERCYDHVIENDLNKARATLERIREIQDTPDNDISDALEAMIYYAAGDEPRAMARYQEVIDAHGDSPETLLNIAGHFSMFGQDERTEQLLDQAEILARAENDQAVVQLVEEFREHLLSDEDDWTDA